MKLDIAGESLSKELLASSHVGELSDTELEGAFGGWVGGYSNVYQHNESYALLCELNVFSLSVVGNIALLGSVAQPCIKG